MEISELVGRVNDSAAAAALVRLSGELDSLKARVSELEEKLAGGQ